MTRTEKQHIFNPLHIYCRLMDLGLSHKYAMGLAKGIEKIIKSFLYERRAYVDNN